MLYISPHCNEYAIEYTIDREQSWRAYEINRCGITNNMGSFKRRHSLAHWAKYYIYMEIVLACFESSTMYVLNEIDGYNESRRYLQPAD